jgi:predicted dehydrogenase
VIGAKPDGIAGEHIRALRRIDGAELVAVCNSDPAVLAAAQEAAGPQARGFGEVGDLLDAGGLDAVVVATPNFTHEAILADCFAAGLPVLAEKPLAPTVAGCQRIGQLAEKHSALLQVGLQRRFAPVYTKLAEWIAAGRLGRPVMMWSQELRGDWMSRMYQDPVRGEVNWRHVQELSGGSLVEKNCHDFDTFNSFAGAEPTRVTAAGGQARFTDRETIDHATVLIEYANGFTATLHFSLMTPKGFPGRYVGLVGPDGAVRISERVEEMEYFSADGQSQERYAPTGGQPVQGHGEAVYLEHVAFDECVRTRTAPVVGAAEALLSVAVAQAAQLAIARHSSVDLAEVLSDSAG